MITLVRDTGLVYIYPGTGNHEITVTGEARARIHFSGEGSQYNKLLLPHINSGDYRVEVIEPLLFSKTGSGIDVSAVAPADLVPGWGGARTGVRLSDAKNFVRLDSPLTGSVMTLAFRVRQPWLSSGESGSSSGEPESAQVLAEFSDQGKHLIRIASAGQSTLDIQVDVAGAEQPARLQFMGFFSPGEEWTHLAITVDEAGVWQVYRNAQLQPDTMTAPVETLVRSHNYLGRGIAAGTNAPVNRVLEFDQVVIVPKVLTAETVEQLYESDSGRVITINGCDAPPVQLNDWPDYLEFSDGWFWTGSILSGTFLPGPGHLKP